MAVCNRCGDQIGVYEPLIVVDEVGAARLSSLAADPGLRRDSGELYHAACYLEPTGTDSPFR